MYEAVGTGGDKMKGTGISANKEKITLSSVFMILKDKNNRLEELRNLSDTLYTKFYREPPVESQYSKPVDAKEITLADSFFELARDMQLSISQIETNLKNISDMVE